MISPLPPAELAGFIRRRLPAQLYDESDAARAGVETEILGRQLPLL
jgi:hypothetical protein